MKGRRIAPLLLALLITLYGGLLRLDAFAGKYPPLDHPRWARAISYDVAAMAASLRPSSIDWRPETAPYAGGDPINYLRFAREMRGFYDAHVREPIFLALTRGWLWALDGQDAAVSFASMTGSTLVIFATYLLGSAVWSRAAGLLAALLVAIEHEMISWAPDGWRDDTFAAAVVLSAWALIRLNHQPSTKNALLAGGLCGVACLTRVTALSFVLPGIAWLVLAPRPDRPVDDGVHLTRQRRAGYAAIAAATCALVLGPFLINCAIATGDPLFAINYHTIYYRHAEGRAIEEPVSATAYVVSKYREYPVRAADTTFEGLFLQPFIHKWRGFNVWRPELGDILRGLSLLGIAACAFFPAGRLLLVLLVTSLVPYMVTWNIADGNAFRFTMHAYPFYLVALACAVIGAVRAVAWLRSTQPAPPAVNRYHLGLQAAVVAVLVTIGVLAYFVLPWFLVREAISKGESTSIETGRRDHVFYSSGWSPPHRDGIIARVSGARSTIRIPLVAGRDHVIVLRMDPAAPGVQETVGVLFNGHLLDSPRLTWDAARVGSYRIPVRSDIVRSRNELTIIPDSLVSAGSAGARFAWLDPEERIGVRLWYVRVLPQP